MHSPLKTVYRQVDAYIWVYTLVSYLFSLQQVLFLRDKNKVREPSTLEHQAAGGSSEHQAALRHMSTRLHETVLSL